MKSVHRPHTKLRAKLEELLKNHTTILEETLLATTMASEEVLRRDWDSEEEDSAWMNL
jgi:hypothetical protein